jgi:hypothetical protein
MTQEYPITPLPELVKQWLGTYFGASVTGEVSDVELALVNQAARWGADQQLLACGKYLEQCAAWEEEDVTEMYNYLRPKPPSLKEQALKELKDWTDEKHGPGGEVFICEGLSVSTIRRALESLPD